MPSALPVGPGGNVAATLTIVVEMIAVVLNTESGPRRPDVRGEIAHAFRGEGIDPTIRAIGDPVVLADAAREVRDAGAHIVVAAGGDGTISAVASAVAGTSVPLGVLPLGTLNHFAKDAGIPIDLTEAVRTIVHGVVRRVDLGSVNDRVFVNNASIGVYPDMVAVRERLRAQGHSKVIASIRATFEVLRRNADVTVHLEADSVRVAARTPFLFVSNNEYLVEGIKIGARTRLDGGRLFAYFAPPVRTRDLPTLFARSVFGIARRDHALETLSANELWVRTSAGRTISVACDGELVSLSSPLHYRSHPAALNLIGPPSAA